MALLDQLNHFAGALPYTDVVGIYKQDFTQVFSRARPIKVTVKPESKEMEQPLETGATIIDHRILLPITIEMALIIQAPDYRDVYQQIAQLYVDSELLIVQTKAETYYNFIISGFPHEESAEMYDALALGLKLKQVQFADTTVSFVPKNPTKGNTKERGNLQPKPATPAQEGSWIGEKVKVK